MGKGHSFYSLYRDRWAFYAFMWGFHSILITMTAWVQYTVHALILQIEMGSVWEFYHRLCLWQKLIFVIINSWSDAHLWSTILKILVSGRIFLHWACQSIGKISQVMAFRLLCVGRRMCIDKEGGHNFFWLGNIKCMSEFSVNYSSITVRKSHHGFKSYD